jgi:hypothetical protein
MTAYLIDLNERDEGQDVVFVDRQVGVQPKIYEPSTGKSSNSSSSSRAAAAF